MVQIALLKSREATVVALVHVLHRRSCRDAAWFIDAAGLQKYLLHRPPLPHTHPLGWGFTPCIVGTFVHLQLHGCLVCSNVACGERSCSCPCCRLLEEQKSRWDERTEGKPSERKRGSYWTLTVSLSPSEPLLESPCREEYTQLWSSWFCWQCSGQQGAAERGNRRKIRNGPSQNYSSH